MVVANSYILETVGSDEGWLAVGDAASAYDPLSAIGIAKAMDSGLHAAEVIAHWFLQVPNAVASYQAEVQGAFNHYLQQRQLNYSKETRWPQQAFWARRQQWLGIHPEKMVISNCLSSGRMPHRILSSTELSSLVALCERQLPVHEVVRAYQHQTARHYPDWRVIQALQYLIETKHLIAA